MREALKQGVLLLICWLNCAIASSQTSISELILDAYHSSILSSEEADIVERIKPLKLLSGNLVNSQSDSIQYLYHYCLASLSSLEDNEVESLNHIDIALQLREKSVGIKDAEYLELLCTKAGILEELEPTKAMSIYQKAYVVGQSLLPTKDDAIKFWFGQCLSSLGNLYIQRNYVQQVIALYRDAFNFTSACYEADNVLSYKPLFDLEQFYYQRKEYDKSISVCDELLNFFIQRNVHNTIHFAQILYFKATALDNMNRVNEAINCYEQSIAICTGLQQLEECESSYANLHLLLLKEERFERADSIEDEYISILQDRNDLDKIVAQYYAASHILLEKGILEKSEAYIDKCFPLIDRIEPSTKELIYSRKSLLRFRQNDIQSALQYKELAIACSTSSNIGRINNQLDKAFLISVKDKDQGLEEYDRILWEMEVRNQDTIPVYESAISQIVSIYENANEYEKEIAFLGDILFRFSTKYGKEHRIYADCMNMQGVGYLKLNHGSQALSIFEQVKQLYIGFSQQNTVNYAIILHNIGRAYMLLDKKEDALRYLMLSKQMQMQLTDNVMDRTQEYIDAINQQGE